MDKCSTTSSENESTELNNVASLSLPVLSSAQDDSSENVLICKYINIWIIKHTHCHIKTKIALTNFTVCTECI